MSPSKPHQEIEEINDFPQFDVVSDTWDHHYAYSNFSFDCSNYYNHKKIMKEWKILAENLPPTIFVRVYENRIDLMRAVIIGAGGTPYHDGLYLFDIAFPNDYPTRPPLVHYQSYGLHINPNLYPCGKVCLSLLNTWSGQKGERWNPEESTILQVLVSIQALVLNEKPYFNEPARLWTGEKRSNLYNEDVFVLCCRTMLYTLRRPPKNFESLVIKHFKERGCLILKACVAYVKNRAKVGYYGCEGSFNCEVSRKFKKSMMILVPTMVDAFTRNGGSELETFVEQMKTVSCERKKTSRVVVKKKKTNGGVVMRFFGTVKKMLGLKTREKNGSGDKNNSSKT